MCMGSEGVAIGLDIQTSCFKNPGLRAYVSRLIDVTPSWRESWPLYSLAIAHQFIFAGAEVMFGIDP